MSWIITGTEKTPVDPYFSNVSLLLHGDGANGSTTIVDSSPSPKTVTAVGNAQISTAQSKFGGASLTFDGSGDYLQNPDHPGLDLITSLVDFTIEAWVHPNTLSSAIKTVVSSWPEIGALDSYILACNSSGAAGFYWAPHSAEDHFLFGGSITIGSWSHIAVTRAASTFSLFVNGSLVDSNTNSATKAKSADTRIGMYGNGALGASPGSYWDGYIDDLRITKGVARYTSNFTPPTAPFPDF